MKITIFVFFIFLLFMFNCSVNAGEEDPAAVIEDFSIDGTFSDFADVEAYIDFYVENYSSAAGAEYLAEYYTGSGWVTANSDRFWVGPTPPTPPFTINYEDYFDVEDIAWKGNGTFRISVEVFADNEDDSAGPDTFYVNDNTAPATPTGLDIEEQQNHPYLTWDENTEIDFGRYKIYKKVGSGSFSWLTNTVNEYYMDYNEYMCGSQHYPNPTIVQYRISAEDYIPNESGYTTAVQCTCKGDPPDRRTTNKFYIFSSSNLTGIPNNFEIQQNYPNPFNPETNITFGIPEDNFVTLVVYNIYGEKVATLVNEQLAVGSYTSKFDGSLLPSGVYIYKIKAGSFTQIKRMLLIK